MRRKRGGYGLFKLRCCKKTLVKTRADAIDVAEVLLAREERDLHISSASPPFICRTLLYTYFVSGEDLAACGSSSLDCEKYYNCFQTYDDNDDADPDICVPEDGYKARDQRNLLPTFIYLSSLALPHQTKNTSPRQAATRPTTNHCWSCCP